MDLTGFPGENLSKWQSSSLLHTLFTFSAYLLAIVSTSKQRLHSQSICEGVKNEQENFKYHVDCPVFGRRSFWCGKNRVCPRGNRNTPSNGGSFSATGSNA
jgi:hypothetical protein